MKAITSREKQIAKRAANMFVDEQLRDVVNRAQCMVYSCMLNAGLSVKTVNRTIAELPDVLKNYGEMRREDLGDYDMIQGLIDRGVKVSMTWHEL